MIYKSIEHCLNQIKGLLVQIDDKDYSLPCTQLSNASIGEHVRHIIEMFQCLEKGYSFDLVDYDNRKRDKEIETNSKYAIQQIDELLQNIDKPNKAIILKQTGLNEDLSLNSNYYRELVYNLEHCIHHQALIKVGLSLNFNYEIDPDFGVAFSTIEYRKQCAQ